MSALPVVNVCKLFYLNKLQLNISSVRTYASFLFLIGKAPGMAGAFRSLFNLYIQYSGLKVTTTPVFMRIGFTELSGFGA
jgi:hypothetical protein